MLYQLSYASGPLNSRKEEQTQDRQPIRGCQDGAAQEVTTCEKAASESEPWFTYLAASSRENRR